MSTYMVSEIEWVDFNYNESIGSQPLTISFNQHLTSKIK